MNFHRVRPSTIAILLCGVFVLATGMYTDNGGFQLAGCILLVIGLINALNQALGRDADS